MGIISRAEVVFTSICHVDLIYKLWGLLRQGSYTTNLTFETYKRNCNSYFIDGNHDRRLFEVEPIDDSDKKSINLIRSLSITQVIHFH